MSSQRKNCRNPKEKKQETQHYKLNTNTNEKESGKVRDKREGKEKERYTLYSESLSFQRCYRHYFSFLSFLSSFSPFSIHINHNNNSNNL